MEYRFLFKIGDRPFMERLLNEGEMYCRTMDYFRQVDHLDLRGDKNEGDSYIHQIPHLEMSIEGQVIGVAKDSQFFSQHNDDDGNIFCMTGIRTASLNLRTKTARRLSLNMNGLSFGDSAIFIHDPVEFVRRVTEAINFLGFKFKILPVTYYDQKVFNGRLGPFYKPVQYKEQNEVRLWISNNQNKDLTLKIGNISDIAALLDKSKLSAITYRTL